MTHVEKHNVHKHILLFYILYMSSKNTTTPLYYVRASLKSFYRVNSCSQMAKWGRDKRANLDKVLYDGSRCHLADAEVRQVPSSCW